MAESGWLKKSEAGSASILGMAILIALLGLSAVVASHGAFVSDVTSAHDIANDAARLGAQYVDEQIYLETGEIRLDKGKARAAVFRYLDSQRLGSQIRVGSLSVDDDTVTVSLILTPRIGAEEVATIWGKSQVISPGI